MGSAFGVRTVLLVAAGAALLGTGFGFWLQSRSLRSLETRDDQAVVELPPWPSTALPPVSEVNPPARVILIGVDTLRADRLSSFGYERETSPNLDRLAEEEGVRFVRAYASSSWTLPSMTSLFTSLHPPQHLVEDRGTRLAPEVPTLAGAFAAQGWLTAGFVTHIYVSSLFGLDSGFSEWRELSIDWNFREGQQLRADALNDHVLRWLDQHRDKRFFLYIHYFDPHWDYAPPSPYDRHFTDPDYSGRARGTFAYLRRFIDQDRLVSPADLRHINDLYDGEIRWTDHEIGRLFERLKELDLWDDTLLAVTSDHGEEFQEHNSFHHIRTLYEEVLHVPLIIKLPGGRPRGWRETVTERVPLVDLATTLLHASRVHVPDTFEGRTLIPLMKAPGPERPVFARTLRHTEGKITLIESGYKLIRSQVPEGARLELYDLSADPGEKTSIEGTESERAVRLEEQLDAWLQRMLESRSGLGGSGLPVVLTPEQREHLRALGYLN
jgi:arylsulfatase A-like enzyme